MVFTFKIDTRALTKFANKEWFLQFCFYIFHKYMSLTKTSDNLLNKKFISISALF